MGIQVPIDNPGIGEFELVSVTAASTSDPGAGKWQTNAGNTRLDVSYTGIIGLDVSSIFAVLQVGAHIYLRTAGEARTYIIGSGGVADRTTYYEIDVTLVADSTSFTLNLNDIHSLALPDSGGDAGATEGVDVKSTGVAGSWVLSADGDDTSSWQPPGSPLAHLLGGASHTADTLANLNSKVNNRDLVADAGKLDTIDTGAVAEGASGDAYATSHDASSTAHDATEIVNQPAGGISATTVQGAIDELDGDKSTTGHVHTLADISDSGTAAAQDVGVTVGDVAGVVDVGGGTPGLAAIDGSLLTGMATGNPIEVEDDVNGVLTTGVTKFYFAGDGVTATNPTGEEVTVTIAPGAAPVNSVFGQGGDVTEADANFTAADIANVPAGDIAAPDVQAAINELDTDKAPVSHTQAYTSVDGVPTDTFLGRDTAGTGATEALNPTNARALLNVEDGSVAAGVSGDAYATAHAASNLAHDAAEIINTPAGSISAVNVQTAINELDTEKSDTAHTHTLEDVTDSGTAAAEDVGTTIDDVVQLVNVGGNPGLPVVDGSQLTDVVADANIEVVDADTGPTTLTTNVKKFTWTGAGVVLSEPVADEITVTISGGGGGAIDITDGTTTVSAADLLTFNATAFDVVDQGANDADVNPIFNTTAGTFAEGDHTHETLVNVTSGVILGRDTAGSGASEELTPAEARTLIGVTLGNIGAGTHLQLETASADSGSIFASLQSGQVAGLTEKTVPIAADTLLMEDSAASDAKKYIQIGNLAGALDHADLGAGIGTNTHAQIDTHIADLANPHATDIGNLGTGTAEELSAALVNANIDGTSPLDIVRSVDIGGGNSGLPVMDGSNLTGITGGASGASLTHKNSVIAATTANGALTTAYANTQSVDGVTLATGDRILLKDQTTGSENGIYTVEATGEPTRATDLDTAAGAAGASTLVEQGTANASTYWSCTSVAGSDVVGTDSLTFANVGVVADDSTIEIHATNGLQVKDDGITLAKMAGGTDGNLITYDAAGDPAYVATGTAGQLLTSNGAGAAPTMQDAPYSASGKITTQGAGQTTVATITAPGAGDYVLHATVTAKATTTSIGVTFLVYINGASTDFVANDQSSQTVTSAGESFAFQAAGNAGAAEDITVEALRISGTGTYDAWVSVEARRL